MIYVIIILLSVALCIFGGYTLYKANQIKITKIHQQSEVDLLNIRVNAFKQQLETLRIEQSQKKKEIEELEEKIKNRRLQVEKDYTIEKELVQNQLKDFKKVTQQAADIYFENLQKDYEHAEAAHKQHLNKLQAEYNRATADLRVIKETRQAAYEALLRENQIKQNKDNYRLKPSRQDLEDIATLEHIRHTLHKPRILSMLMWQTYWQPLAKKQFPIILQDKTKVGIYKITSIKTDQAYIGQSLIFTNDGAIIVKQDQVQILLQEINFIKLC